jgi:phosphoglucosamine mutase
VGNYPLDNDSIVKLGHSIGTLLKGCRILVGRDTRASGEKIIELLTTGAADKAKLFDCGIMPTPGISFLTGRGDFDYGIMITASHNPYFDNGIKIFNSKGEKISTAFEQKIENVFFSLAADPKEGSSGVQPDIGKIRVDDMYRDFLIGQVSSLPGKNLKAVIDCAHGAAFEIAPLVFKAAGFDTEIINAAPDGKNINRDSGSTNPELLKNAVISRQADMGIAFDGDGDRVIFACQNGNILDGDHSLYTISKYLLETNRDFNKIVVGTIMGNLGLEKALLKMGMTYIRTPVGDRQVYGEMKKMKALVGGEQSGHTILRFLQRTGDGILTAIYFIKALSYFNLKPADIFKQLPLYPQITKSIVVREKKEIESWDKLKKEIENFNRRHGKNSRIITRYSGTEPKIRVMIESEDSSVIHENIEKFENLIKSEIGG